MSERDNERDNQPLPSLEAMAHKPSSASLRFTPPAGDVMVVSIINISVKEHIYFENDEEISQEYLRIKASGIPEFSLFATNIDIVEFSMVESRLAVRIHLKNPVYGFKYIEAGSPQTNATRDRFFLFFIGSGIDPIGYDEEIIIDTTRENVIKTNAQPTPTSAIKAPTVPAFSVTPSVCQRLCDSLTAFCSSNAVLFTCLFLVPILTILLLTFYGINYGFKGVLLVVAGPLLIWAGLKVIRYIYEKTKLSSAPDILYLLTPVLQLLYAIILLLLLCTGAMDPIMSTNANGISSNSGQNIEIKNAEYHVTYSAKRTRNNSVGNEWNHGIKIDGEIVQNNSDVTTTPTITVTAFASEYDDSSSDYGSSDVKFKSLDVGESASKEVKVTVKEDKGRYSGNTATWEFEITVERIS